MLINTDHTASAELAYLVIFLLRETFVTQRFKRYRQAVLDLE